MEKMKEGHKQRMEFVYLVGTLLVMAGLVAALVILFFKTTSDDVRKIVAGSLVSVFTAWIGYVAGRASGKSG